MQPTADDVLLRLGASKHLDRERALRDFQQLVAERDGKYIGVSCGVLFEAVVCCCCQQLLLSSDLFAGSPVSLNQLANGVKSLLASEAWEHKIGGLMAAKVHKQL